MVARGQDGETRCYPVVEMAVHAGENILDLLLAPARIPFDVAEAARKLAIDTVEALAGVGIFGIEMFLTQDGELLVNEVAPRTHNSGHYTIEACMTDQFEQHLRAIAGLPLGATDLLAPAAMINLLGAPGFGGRPVIRGLRAAWPSPVSRCISTARPPPAPIARWATSPSSITTLSKPARRRSRSAT
jgi:5-(carboxyamino)imidazole ribonucleotide synthase